MITTALILIAGSGFSDLPWPLEQAGYSVEYRIHETIPPDPGGGWYCILDEAPQAAICYDVRALRGGSFCPAKRNLGENEHPIVELRWKEEATRGYFWSEGGTGLPTGSQPDFFHTPDIWFTFDRFEFIPSDPNCEFGAGCGRLAQLFIKGADNPAIFDNGMEYKWNPIWSAYTQTYPVAWGAPYGSETPCRGFWVITPLGIEI
jgi:hypothetical protein